MCCSTPSLCSFVDRSGVASIATSPGALNEDFSPCPHRPIPLICKGFLRLHTGLHRCGKRLGRGPVQRPFHDFSTVGTLWTNRRRKRSGYTRPRPASVGFILL